MFVLESIPEITGMEIHTGPITDPSYGKHCSVTLLSFGNLLLVLLKPGQGYGRCWRPVITRSEAERHHERVASPPQGSSEYTARGDFGSVVRKD